MNIVAQGHPSDFSTEVEARICQELSEGKTLREVCRADEMPTEAAVRKRALADPEGFGSQYAKAREIGYQSMADELLEIADDGTNDWMERQNGDGTTYEVENREVLNRSRLRVDTRKWLLSKALPKIYGDKITTEHSGPNGGPIETANVTDIEAARRIAFFLESATKGKT